MGIRIPVEGKWDRELIAGGAIAVLLLVAFLIYLLASPALQHPGYHTVRKGETLWSIAEKAYGNGRQWPRIYMANRADIENPDRIWPGMLLRLPQEGKD